jgi:lipoate-protein ligase B
MNPISYQEGLAAQGRSCDKLIVFRPLPVVTSGKNIPNSEIVRVEAVLSRIGIPLLPTDRGGQFTFHHSGQLLLFPEINLVHRRIGLRSFVERALSVVAEVLNRCGVPCRVRLDQAGVWTVKSGKKICSIGLKVANGEVRHGLSLSVLAPDPDLVKPVYNLVDICGLSGSCITSIEEETGNCTDFEILRQDIENSWRNEFQS